MKPPTPSTASTSNLPQEQGKCPVVIDPTGSDIHAENTRIREHGPISQVELPHGVRAWSVTGYEAGKQVLADRRFSKDGRRHWAAFVNGQIDPQFPLIGWALMGNLAATYGSVHRRLRQPVAKVFTPLRVEAMRPTIVSTVASLLDDLSSGPRDAIVDLKARFAQPLAAEVMSGVIGVPTTSLRTLLAGGEAQVDTTKTAAEIAASVEQSLAEMAALVEAKRHTATDDLMTDLIGAQDDDGAELGDTEIIGTLLLLLGTGMEPATNLVTNSILGLLVHPDQRQMISTGQASWQDAIEETLRTEAPVAHLPFRFATEDIQLGEVTIPAGDPVLMNFAAMGRDPAVHGASAGSFDVTRPGKSHLSFGHGMYACIGMHLGRLETETAVPALFERFPDLALAVPAAELEPQNSFIMNGCRALPILLGAR